MRLVLFVLLVLGLSAPAFATVPPADDYARAGADALAKKKYDDAAGQYLLAYLSDVRPERLLDLARAYQAMKNKQVAIMLYQLVEQQAGNTPTGAAAHGALVQLGAAAPPPPPATLMLTVMPPGADVRIDGVLVGKAPMGAIPLTPGARRLEVSLTGYSTVQQDLAAQPGLAMAVVMTLVPAPAAVAEATPPPVVAPPPVLTPPPTAPPAQAGSLAGSWFGSRFSNAGRRDQQTLTLVLAGNGLQVSGEARLTTLSQVPGYRKAQCGGATELVTVTKYRARYSGNNESGRLLAEGGSVTSCSCEGLCSAAGDQEWEVVLSPRGGIMVDNTFFFQRYEGAAPPEVTVRTVDAKGMAGSWTARIGGVPGWGKATISPAGAGISGSMTQERTSPVQGWRRADCGGADTVTATHRYALSGEAEDAGLDLDFKHKGTENCTCKEGACAAAGAGAGIGGGASFWTLDGDHIVAPGLLLVRD